MANTTADKLAKLNSTKEALKTAINGSGNLVGDVFADYPTAVTDGKAGIAAAITEKGVTTTANATFQQMAANIGSIQTGQSYEETTEFSTFVSWWEDHTESDKFGVIVSVFDPDVSETRPIFAGFSWIGTTAGAFGSTNISITIPTFGVSFFYGGGFAGYIFELYITNLDNHDNIVHLLCDGGEVITENNSLPDLFSFTFFAIR